MEWYVEMSKNMPNYDQLPDFFIYLFLVDGPADYQYMFLLIKRGKFIVYT